MTNRYDYAVISDLHINSDACVTKSLISFLENIYDDKIKIDRLIINGDILDSYSLNKLSADQLKIFDLLHWLNYKERVLWIEGNHDRPAEKLQALCGFKLLKSLVVSSGRKIIYLEHGDRADDFIQKHPKLTKETYSTHTL
jgi:UDP-2,3-diacylglucosamine pyrophosphatase LpxH